MGTPEPDNGELTGREVTARQLQDEIGVDIVTIYKLRKDGVIPFIMKGKQFLFDLEAVKKALEGKKIRSAKLSPAKAHALLPSQDSKVIRITEAVEESVEVAISAFKKSLLTHADAARSDDDFAVESALLRTILAAEDQLRAAFAG